jgi:hypothetical protein
MHFIVFRLKVPRDEAKQSAASSSAASCETPQIVAFLPPQLRRRAPGN